MFAPGNNDPKSILLKRGPILLNGGKEREMLLFTHGFLLSRIELGTALNILFAINSKHPQYSNSRKLKDQFNTITSDKNGGKMPYYLYLHRILLARYQHPSSFRLMQPDETIDFAEFESAINDLARKKEERWTWALLGETLKRTFIGQNVERKVECAFSYANIAKVESINICYSGATSVYVGSSWAELIFAIYIEARDEPFIIVCSKPEHRSAWVDAFRICCVNSVHLRADMGSSAAKQVREQPGWQHRIIRASLFSFVCTNDVKGLGERLATPSPDIDVDDQDEYRGCSALHYAAILGHCDCAIILLRHRASVNLEDNDQKTPFDHGKLLFFTCFFFCLLDNILAEANAFLFSGTVREL